MPSSFLHINRHRWLFAAGFLLLIFIQVQVLRSIKIGWNLALWDSAITNVVLAAGCTLMMFNFRYFLPGRNKYVIILVWSATVAGITSAATKYLLGKVFKDDVAYLQLLENSGTIRFWVSVLVISWMAVVGELWYRQQENVEGEKRKADAERLAKDAELYKLRQQLQPHFLFNSLNSISALAGSQPEQARKMIHQLSEFLRGTLRKEEHQWVTMSDELQHLGLYLDIEKVRFGHRLSTEITCDESAGALRLPPMLLQPIVENAIKFGLYDTTDSITVLIQAKKFADQLVIEVQNPFDPETSSPQQGTGFGLSSVKRRLYLLFARNDLLITKVDDNLFTTIVKIPQHDQDDLNR